MIMGANCGLDDYNPQNSFFNQMLKCFATPDSSTWKCDIDINVKTQNPKIYSSSFCPGFSLLMLDSGSGISHPFEKHR